MHTAETVLLPDLCSDTRRGAAPVSVPGGSPGDQLVQEVVELLDGDAGHHDHMGDVALAGELPAADEPFVLGSLEHHGAAERVEHGAHPRRHEPVPQVMRVAQAFLDLLPESPVPLPVEGVPEEERGVAIAAAHDGGVPGRQVFDVARQGIDVLQPRYLDAAGHGTSHELVTRHAHAPYRLLKRHLGCLSNYRYQSDVATCDILTTSDRHIHA